MGSWGAITAWLVAYGLVIAVQHFTIDRFYGLTVYLLNGGVLLVALLDLARRKVGMVSLVFFIGLAFGTDWVFKSAVAGLESLPALFLALTLVLQAWLGLWLLQRAGLTNELPDTQKKVLAFVWWGAFLPTLASSLMMLMISFSLSLHFDPTSFGEEFLWWFVSRFTSLILVAPVILLGLNHYSTRGQSDHPFFGNEFWWLAIGAVLFAGIVFLVANPPGLALATYSYLLIPLMLVIAVRLPLFQSLLILFLVGIVSFWADAETSVTPEQARRSLMALSTFLVINSGIVWFVGALLNDLHRSFANEKQHRRLYEMLSRINQTIVKNNLDQELLFARVCKIILEESDFQQVCVVPNPESGRPNSVAPTCFRSPGEQRVSASVVNEQCELIRVVLAERRLAAFSSCQTCPRFNDCALKPIENGSMAAFPIRQDAEITAILAIFASTTGVFGEAHLRLFQEMADDIGFATDMYVQRQHLKQIAEVFHYSGESIIIADTKGTILNVNPSFTRITGYSFEEAVGNNPRVLQSGRQEKPFYEHLFEQLHAHGYWSGEFWNKRKNGELYLQRGTISTVRDEQGQPKHYIAIMEDASAQIEAEEKIQALVNFDQLTGLPNRTLLSDRFNQAVGHSRRTGCDWSLMFIDLDDFKQVNDALGHQLGDQLLKEVAQRFKVHIREIDTLCRFGGDEFILLMQGGANEAAELAKRLIDEVSHSYELQGDLLHVGASIGISSIFQDGETLDGLIQAADTAMYQAKSEGRGCFRFFAKTMQSEVQHLLALKQALKKALTENELCLFYQPKVVCARNGEVRKVGYEALVRWNHPDTGMISPGEFIPAAEQSGQIADIDRWVIERAICQLATWLQQRPQDVLPVAINVSASLFSKPGFVDELKALIESSGVPAELIELEITEHAATIDIDRTLRTLKALKAIGVYLSIDDFGTGYSSLSYLWQFPIDYLKIDLSFVRDVHLHPKRQGLVKAIITMAHSLGMTTIAEGVEVREEVDFLLENGCDAFQGYYFGKPVPVV